jgi:hypothetical protein
VIAIGLRRDAAKLGDCNVAATIDNDAGADNDEQGTQVLVCTGPIRPWSQLWPELQDLG